MVMERRSDIETLIGVMANHQDLGKACDWGTIMD